MVTWSKVVERPLASLGFELVPVTRTSYWVRDRRTRRSPGPQADDPRTLRRGRTRRSTDSEAARPPKPERLALADREMLKNQRKLFRHLSEAHVALLLEQLNINCVLDVGANVGQYARALRNNGYTGRIVSFEPVPHLAKRLRVAAESDDDWHVHECALGNVEEDMEMSLSTGPGTTSSLLPASSFGLRWSSRLGRGGQCSVKVRRLDAVFDDVLAGVPDPRVFLKLDTQGYDLRAFSGAGDHLDQVLALQSEVSSLPLYEGMPRLPEQIEAYEDKGFQHTGIYPVSYDKPTGRVVEFDVVMVKLHKARG